MDQNTNPQNASQAAAQPQPQASYNLEIEDSVVEKIASLATQKIDGVMEMKGNIISSLQDRVGQTDQTKGVSADVNDNRVSVDVSIVLEYGKSAKEVFEKIKDYVVKEIKKITALEVSELTVHVQDIMTREEYREQQAKRQNNNN